MRGGARARARPTRSRRGAAPDRLVKRGEPDRDARQHGQDAEQDLRPERGVDRDRGRPRDAFGPCARRDQRRDHHPCPPAVEEVDQDRDRWSAPTRRRASSRCLRGRSGRACPASLDDLTGVEARDPGAEHQLDEQDRRARARRRPVRRDGRSRRSAPARRRSSATQISAPMMASASSRCADRRKWLTSVRCSRPDMTMYQPSAPCSAAEHEQRRPASSHSPWGSRASARTRRAPTKNTRPISRPSRRCTHSHQ